VEFKEYFGMTECNAKQRFSGSGGLTAALLPILKCTSRNTEQARKFVLVVDADNVARPKYVTLGPVVEGLRVVEGIAPDDNVIVNGLVRARPGAKVTPHRPSTAAAPAQSKVD